MSRAALRPGEEQHGRAGDGHYGGEPALRREPRGGAFAAGGGIGESKPGEGGRQGEGEGGGERGAAHAQG